MKSKAYFLLILSCLISWNVSAGAVNLHQKYPDMVVGENYEILNESDIIFDIKNLGRGATVWECFSVKDVKYSYTTSVDVDPTGDTKEINTMCEFIFLAKKKGVVSIYHDRRTRDIYGCREIDKKWKKITKGQTHVCLNGSFGSIEKNKKMWFWERFKTKIGCDSFFEDYCYTRVKKREF